MTRARALRLAGSLAARLVTVVHTSCTPAQLDAFDRSLDRIRDLAGDVCLEHDGWEACLKKCEAEKEKRDAVAADP